MKKFLITIVTAALVIAAYAVPAIPGAFVVTQPDGSEITINLIGDEHFHYNTSEDGFLIVKNITGYWNYAIMEENGVISASEFIYHKPELRSEREINFLENVLKKNDFRTIARKTMELRSAEHFNKMQASRSPQATSGLGERGIAILVSFSDRPFLTTNANTKFNNLLNQEGYSESNAIGSARDYFIACSDSAFQPAFDVFGPYTLPQTMAYYGANNSSGQDIRPGQMVIDACIAANSAGVDFSLYDTDGNGKVDNIFIFYAGYAESNSEVDENAIWPHRSIVSGNNEFDGVRIYDYACASELRGSSGSRMAGIGTFCHEFSHVLGLPDYYNTNTKSSVIYSWNLMDQGCYLGPGNYGDVPCFYSAYDRFFVGWFTPTILNTSSSENDIYTLYPMTSAEKNAFIVTTTENHNLIGKDPDPTEFFILENRKLESFDRYLPNSGMLIWRINYSASAWNGNTCNNNNPPRVDIIEADGDNSKETLSRDVFPGNTGQYTAYRFQGRNNEMWNSGVYNITKEEDNITFFFTPDIVPVINTEIQQLNIAYLNNGWKIDLEQGNYQANLFSTTGQLIFDQLFTGELVINNGILANGTYVIVVNDLNSNKKYQAKVVR
jgi:M6 family metalloprotease-like protein